MIVAESTRTRRIVGRLDRGTDILQQLHEVCIAHRVHAGALRAVGALEDAVVVAWDQSAKAAGPSRRFHGPVELLSLEGTVGDRNGAPALSAFAALSRSGDNGIELLGGRLVSGRVYACEFVLDAFDDLQAPSTLDATTGLHLWAARNAHDTSAQLPPPTVIDTLPSAATAAPSPAASQSSSSAATAPSWSDVIAKSEAHSAPTPAFAAVDEEPPSRPLTGAAAAAGAGESPEVKPGDYIDHPKFGRIQVERIDGDMEYVSARMRNQRLIRLSLEVLTLVPAGQSDEGRKIFRAVNTAGGAGF